MQSDPDRCWARWGTCRPSRCGASRRSSHGYLCPGRNSLRNAHRQAGFQARLSVETLNAILKEEPEELQEISPDLAPGLDRVVRHCLEKNPAQRFQSASDIAFSLEALTGISKVASDIQIPSARKRAWPLPAIIALLALAAAFFLGRITPALPKPEFHQVTFRSGTVYRARFTNDGSSILYSAAWEGKPTELFTTRYGSVESRSLAAETLVAAISSKNQVAILLNPRFLPAGSICLADGTLALLPIEGGAPRSRCCSTFSMLIGRPTDPNWLLSGPRRTWEGMR